MGLLSSESYNSRTEEQSDDGLPLIRTCSLERWEGTERWCVQQSCICYQEHEWCRHLQPERQNNMVIFSSFGHLHSELNGLTMCLPAGSASVSTATRGYRALGSGPKSVTPWQAGIWVRHSWASSLPTMEGRVKESDIFRDVQSQSSN